MDLFAITNFVPDENLGRIDHALETLYNLSSKTLLYYAFV
jgi:hypothetical protein